MLPPLDTSIGVINTTTIERVACARHGFGECSLSLYVSSARPGPTFRAAYAQSSARRDSGI